MSIRFAAVGLSHNHIYNQCDYLLEAGATLVSFYGDEPDRIVEFQQRYPQAQQAESIASILEDESLQLVVSASIPSERPPLGIQVIQHGKDFCCTKPGFATLDQLAEVRRVQKETQRMYAVYFGERYGNKSTVKAGELVQAGAIGQVIQTVGSGPHRLGRWGRPPWTFDKQYYGGILNDLASHQIDQFLFFTGSTQAEIVCSQVANFKHTQYPAFEDFGDLTIRSAHATGYTRVDWLTPDGLGTWGDVRLFIHGTEGYIELRKNCDIAGHPGDNHLFLVDHKGIQYIDCADVPLPFMSQLIQDILNRTETAMSQERCFLACELALKAQAMAVSITGEASGAV